MKYIIIISVLSVFLISIIIAIVLFVLKQKNSKVKATELLDDQDTPYPEKNRNTESINNEIDQNNSKNNIINE